MAIYHLKVKVIQRSKGYSSIKAAAYRSCSKLKNSDGENVNYKKKKGLVFQGIFIPAGSQELSRQELWKRTEEQEKRINSTVAREFEISLPKELNSQQRKDLAKEFTIELVKKYNFYADLCIHEPPPETKYRKSNSQKTFNPHAHILTTTRDIKGKKIRVLDSMKGEQIPLIRKMWENLANEHLQRAGVKEIISCERSPTIEDMYYELKKRKDEEEEIKKEENITTKKLLLIKNRLKAKKTTFLEMINEGHEKSCICIINKEKQDNRNNQINNNNINKDIENEQRREENRTRDNKEPQNINNEKKSIRSNVRMR